MEWIGPVMMVGLGLSLAVQLVTAHALSVIARKQELGSLMEVLAWVPIAQIAPLLAVGGGSLPRFLLGVVGLVIANVVLFGAASFLGDGLGGVMAAVGAAGSVLLALGYLARIAWNTATARSLPGWVGLLIFVPLANLAVYPIIAFHDGWSGPHRVGAALGLLIIVGSSLPTFQAVRMLQTGLEQAESELSTELADWSVELERLDAGAVDPASSFDDDDLHDGTDTTGAPPARPTPATTEAATASIRAFMALKGRFDTLDGLTTPDNLRIQDHRVRALNLIRSIRADLEAQRAALDPETYTTLAGHLVDVEARLQGRASAHHAGRAARPDPNAAALPAAPDPAAAAPLRPYPVHASGDCPPGTELRTWTSDEGDEGDEEWCQQLAQYGGLRHGWYARYFEGGRPEQVGEYRNGLRVGVWTRFRPSGEVRAQAQFVNGLQHGWLLTFDEHGERQKAVRFEEGRALR